MPRVLIACEFSGVVRDAFLAKGIEAYSCDILPAEPPSPFHIQEDVRLLLKHDWDLIIAHPPCTYLCNSGVRWLKTEPGRVQKMQRAAQFFNRFTCRKNIKRVCVENPIMHKFAKEIVTRQYDQIIQPWMFGHPETKATCLWLHNLPKLTPTNIVEGREGRIHKMGPSADRGKLRSITYAGVANAFADQWSILL